MGAIRTGRVDGLNNKEAWGQSVRLKRKMGVGMLRGQPVGSYNVNRLH